MTSMELEAYKAELACEILTTDSRQVLDEVKRLLTKLSKKTKKKEETISKEEILAGIDAGLKDIKAKRTRPGYRITSRIKAKPTSRNRLWWRSSKDSYENQFQGKRKKWWCTCDFILKDHPVSPTSQKLIFFYFYNILIIRTY